MQVGKGRRQYDKIAYPPRYRNELYLLLAIGSESIAFSYFVVLTAMRDQTERAALVVIYILMTISLYFF